MIIFKTLQEISLEKIHETFIKAFSDYEVEIKMSFQQFKKMADQRGMDTSISIGAFDDGKLVGIMLVGLRKWNHEMTAYDVGTGVIKEYRNQKITSKMFEYAKKILKEIGINKYMLEVIQSNDAAVHLYKKQGFKVMRELDCFSASKDKLILDFESYNDHYVIIIDANNLETLSNIKIFDSIDEDLRKEFITFWDFNPSWQNSIDSINVIHEDLTFISLVIDEKITGYAVIDKHSGDIMQFAVDKNYRNQSIGRRLIMSLLNISESKSISILNVESNCESMKKFLLNLGFKNFVSQYEMCLEL